MRVAGVGHALFAATFVALGLWGLMRGGFAPVWEPVPKGFPAREALAYVCALVSLAAGLGLFWRRTAAGAAGVLLVLLLAWLLLFKLSVAVRAPLMAAAWESSGETAVAAAAAWALYARLAEGRPRFAAGEAGLRLAHALYGLALVAFGAAHLAYVTQTASLVPTWLPSPRAWVYLTGATYIAAGLAVLTGVWARLAATLAAAQIGLFTLLVWVLVVAAGSKDPSAWSETVVSWTLTAAAWVLAESYRGPSAEAAPGSKRHRA